MELLKICDVRLLQGHVLAVILAGGRGRRLEPLTHAVPKAMLPVKGKAVVLQQLELLEAAGFERVVLVTGRHGRMLERFVREHGHSVERVHQPEPMGSAHALQQALPLIEGEESFLVLACDYLFPGEHLRDLLEMHRSRKPAATLSLKRMRREEMGEASSVRLEGDRVTCLVEKPSESEILSDIAAAPMYLFSSAAVGFLREVELSPRGEYEIPGAVQSMIEAGFEVRGVLAESWVHLSDWRDLLRLNFGYLAPYL